MERLPAQRRNLLVRTGPGEVDVLGTHGLRVVVGQQRGVLVLGAAAPLEPLGEAGVEPGAARLRKTLVGDLAGQRVLDRVLAFAGHRRAVPPPDEVALLEHGEVGRRPLDEVVDGPGPEDTADHGGSLQRSLLGGRQQVDARGEHRLDRVRHVKALGQPRVRPAAVEALEHAAVDQRGDQLLDEEGVALGALDDDAPQGRGQLRTEQLVEEVRHLVRRQRFEREERRVVPSSAPSGPSLEQLRASGREDEQRSIDAADERLDQVAKIVLGPVQVLDQQHARPLPHKVAEKLYPRVVQPFTADQWVQILADRQAERESEEGPAA